MTIQYPVSPPESLSGVTHRAAIHAETIVSVSRNPFTGQQESFEWGGIWKMDVSLRAMRMDEARRWIAFLTSLHGPAGSFLAEPPAYGGPWGAAVGAPVVLGAGQTGSLLATTGWTAGTPGILLGGDFIQLGQGSSAHLHRVVIDADADQNGEAMLEIWPALRESPADTSAVVVSNPVGHWLLDQSGVPEDMEPGGLLNGDSNAIVQLAFTAREAI